MIDNDMIDNDIEILEDLLKKYYKDYKPMESCVTIDIVAIQSLIKRYKKLEEIEKEHQKLNGDLQKRLTYCEDICKGKSIQELGLSDLYLEGGDGKNNKKM